MSGQPVTPYDRGTSSGFSGSEASEDRAERRDSGGATGRIQRGVLYLTGNSGEFGATVAELRTMFPDDHHGTISGALSVLHKTGALARLTEKRNRCQIYVTPEHVAGREVAPQGRKPEPRNLLTAPEADALASVRQQIAARPLWPEVSSLSVPVDVLQVLVDALARRS